VVEAAFALAQFMTCSDPIQTEQGYTIIVLTQKQPGFSKSLAEAKGDIQSRLTYERRQQKRNALMAEIERRRGSRLTKPARKFTLPRRVLGIRRRPDRRSPGPGPGAPTAGSPAQGR